MLQSNATGKLGNAAQRKSSINSIIGNISRVNNINNSMSNLNQSTTQNFQLTFATKKLTFSSKVIKSSLIKHFSCFIASESYKGIIFLLFLTVKFIVALVLVYHSHSVLRIIESVLFTITIIQCTVCIFSSPGIIPRNNIKCQYKIKNKVTVLRGRVFKSKICRTCGIFRPLGSMHCKRCNICVNHIDHHCNWIGNCIGIQNYRYFYFFINGLNVYLLFGLIASICMIVLNDKTVYIVFSGFMTVVNVVMFLFVCGLVIKHFYLIYIGCSTYMRIKYKIYFYFTGNLFDKGPMKNLRRLLCSKYKNLENFPLMNINEMINSINNNTNTSGEDILKKLNTKKANNIYVNCFINNSNISNSNTLMNVNQSAHLIQTNSKQYEHQNSTQTVQGAAKIKGTNFLNFTFKKNFEEDKGSSIIMCPNSHYSCSKKSHLSNLSSLNSNVMGNNQITQSPINTVLN